MNQSLHDMILANLTSKNIKNQTETNFPRRLLLSYATAHREEYTLYLPCLEMTKCKNGFYLKHRVVIEISKQ